jgi:serine/threonine-protein kinase
VAELGAQAAEALDHAHQLGVVHRDVKPANLLLDGRGDLWVTDFGLAQVRQGEAGLTLTGDVVGTLRYMSPEQALARRAVLDHRTDVYSLGATLYELLTLAPVFPGNDRQELLRQIAFEEPVKPRRLDRAVPADLETVVLKALEKDPADRYATAKELADDLRRFLADKPIWARRPTLRQVAVKWGRRHRAVVWAAAAVLLVAAVLGAGSWLSWERQQAERAADAARQEGALRQDVAAALDQAARLRRGGHFEEAGRLLGQSRQRLEDGGPDDLRQRLDVAEAELALVSRLDAVRQGRAAIVLSSKFNFDNQTAERGYAAAFREAGLGQVGDDEAAVAARITASGVSGPLVAALDDWASVTRERKAKSWLLAVARRAAPDPWGDRFRDPEVWQKQQALLALADDVLRDDGAKLGTLSPQVLVSLGALLGGGADAVPLLRTAQRRYPNDFWLSLDLGNALRKAKQVEEALGYMRVAVALRPDSAVAHTNLGASLRDKGDMAGAIDEFRLAIDLDPELAMAHTGLGLALRDKGDMAGAIDEFRLAIDLDPKLAAAHNNLGLALGDKGDMAGAIDEFRLALALDPKLVITHENLGIALGDKGDMAGAIDEFRLAIKLDPKLATAHNNLGKALRLNRDVAGAIDECRRAIDLDPKLAIAHDNLGLALRAKGDMAGAIDEFRLAIKLDPKYAPAHNNLGKALRLNRDVAGAIDECRRAIDLDPKLAIAHDNLGLALRDKGDMAGAIDEFRLAIDLLPQRDPLRVTMTQHLRQCERMLALEARLPAVLQGKDKPAGASEGLEFAGLCQHTKKRYAAAARFYADAFAAEPKLADDLPAWHRYNAACCAALAGCGQGQDTAGLDDKERARLRRQALDWLHADLGAWRRRLDKEPDKARPAVAKQMQYWLGDADFAGVRGEAALGKLPAAERPAWQKLWEEVESLLRRSAGPAQPHADAGPQGKEGLLKKP